MTWITHHNDDYLRHNLLRLVNVHTNITCWWALPCTSFLSNCPVITYKRGVFSTFAVIWKSPCGSLFPYTFSEMAYPNYGRRYSKQSRWSIISFSSFVFAWVWKIADVFLHMRIYLYRKVVFNPKFCHSALTTTGQCQTQATWIYF